MLSTRLVSYTSTTLSCPALTLSNPIERIRDLMRKFLLAVASAIALAGCVSATTPVAPANSSQTPVDRVLAFQVKTTDTSGEVTVIRDAGFHGSACYYAVSINGIIAARLAVGERATFYVPPGEVLLRAGRDPYGRALCGGGQHEWTQREAVIRQGEQKTYRMSMDVNGKMDIQRTN